MKFFVVSDIHGHYKPLIEALNTAGFEKDNPEHYFVGCGDFFDRGGQPYEVMNFIMNLERKILVRGNHEWLLEQCCYRGDYASHDLSNGTVGTIMAFAEHDPRNSYYFPECADYALKRTRAFREMMVPYFETKNYIFVHSWIPVKILDDFPKWYTGGRIMKFDPDWRNATAEEWDAAMWGNPYDMAEKGLRPDKIVVFGHWHCSEGWHRTTGTPNFGEGSRFDIFYGEGFISIDACTAYTKKVNVLVLEDEFLDSNI